MVRLDYSFNGNRKTLSLGTYPNVTLSDVRNKAVETRQQVAKGIDPGDTRKAASYQLNVKSHLRRDLNPIIGKLPLADITPDQLLEALKLCELRGAATAHRVCKIAELVFQYGIPDICKHNVATDNIS